MLVHIEPQHHSTIFRMGHDPRGMITQWIEENCRCSFEDVNIICKPYRSHGWCYRYYFEFPNEADATLFKLKWL